MEDWRQLRDELASAEENQDNYGALAAMFETTESAMREYDTEDSFADYLEASLSGYIKDGILTDEITARHRDFFDRHGISPDIQDYRSDCRRIRKHIGRQLRDARDTCGLEISDVAEYTGIDKGLISRIEAGRANAEIDTISILAKTYNATITIYG